MYRFDVYTAASGLAISIDDVHAQSRMDFDDEDDLITDFYIPAATDLFEKTTKRTLLETTYELYLDSWENIIWFPRPPLQSVTHVKYYDGDGSEQTLAASGYTVDTTQAPGKLYFKTTTQLPELSENNHPKITIRYVAGYGDSDDIPKLIKTGIAQLVATYYEQRETTGAATTEMPYGFQTACNCFKIMFERHQ